MQKVAPSRPASELKDETKKGAVPVCFPLRKTKSRPARDRLRISKAGGGPDIASRFLGPALGRTHHRPAAPPPPKVPPPPPPKPDEPPPPPPKVGESSSLSSGS